MLAPVPRALAAACASSGAARGVRSGTVMSFATRSHRPLEATFRGAAAGAVATLAMSVLMLVAGRLGIMGKQPPERIVERGAQAADVPATETQQKVVAGAAHIAFGSAAGAALGLIAHLIRVSGERLALPWALTVWAVSYFGWVPALRILPAPPDDRPGRAWTMLAAHVVFGVALGRAWRFLAPRAERAGRRWA